MKVCKTDKFEALDVNKDVFTILMEKSKSALTNNFVNELYDENFERMEKLDKKDLI